MVKGTTKRVIVVKSPNPKVFEQAFFIVREDYSGKEGVSTSDVLRQAQRVADDYIRGTESREKETGIFSRLPPAVFAGLGAAAAGLAWLVVYLAGI